MSFLTKFRAARYLMGPKYRKSYSQCGEDIILSRVLKTIGVTKPFYIDIGTNDPVILNNTYLFYTSGASGICVEPNPLLARKISRKRPRDICVEAGIAATRGNLEYFMFKNDALNTFSSDEAASAEKKGIRLIGKKSTPVITFGDLITKYRVERIDLLSLDVEGMDLEILRAIDFKAVRPKVICVEITSFGAIKAQNNKSEIETFLNGAEYENVSNTPINGIFLDRTYLS